MSYGMSLAKWVHTCHLTQVNTPRLNPSQTNRYSIVQHLSVRRKSTLLINLSHDRNNNTNAHEEMQYENQSAYQ